MAALISLALSRLLDYPESYWAAISAMVVLQPDRSATRKNALNRLAGTAVGAVVGAAVLAWLGSSMVSFGLALVIAFSLCAVTRRWESYRLAGVTVAIVILAHAHDTPWVVAIHRFVEISLGILVAMAVMAIP